MVKIWCWQLFSIMVSDSKVSGDLASGSVLGYSA